ncbi:Lrp/AsnC family transcriptional regulator [Variovorax sp. PBL-E5]|uniref:Lrp/AsnC family transcriptional regulator n=1 Tax=Variovorax sp. PBL-E5 TaxID=434014 RepID=UPI00131763AD|nr:Lrp/AsnC family transcriptional regulator [Variovorax sp. PBL-E5]VTU45341.1 Leucine-responsive regulatory protein [Variovorax sp. PBL-E5]
MLFNKPEELDRGELAILAALQVNARLSTQDLADEVGLSSSATWRRVKALEDRGMIQGYVAMLDAEKLGFKECIFAHVTLAKHDVKSIEEFERSVARRPEVLECFSVAGQSDYVLRVVVRSNGEYEKFLKDAVFSCAAVGHIHSSFTLRKVKFSMSLPVAT